tara:strand:- start:190 stop:1029 length:840 start_codon:yes stop_codon:yes gene_type:complete
MVRVRYSFSSRRTGHTKNIRKQKEKFPKLVKDLIEISEIILEVLDARFVNETRNKELEEEIKTQGKKIIYVLNKSDLVDRRSIIHQKGFPKISPFLFVSCKKRAGISKLRDKIKAEVKKLKIKHIKANVGVIGYPNTGKSSLINLLTGKSSARTGAEAGFTKGVQKISLSKNILLLDTPGVIPESEYSHVKREALQKQIMIGARTINKTREPELFVSGIMKDYSKQIEKFYKIDSQGDSEKLIEELGRRRNFLRKGGVVDEDKTSRLIIKDWQEGKIKI